MSLYSNPPSTRFADTGEGSVGYQVFGSGPVDILFSTGLTSNIEAMWSHPVPASYFERMASFARVVAFDYRGQGVSDPYPDASRSVERLCEDALTALNAAEVEQAAVIGDTEAGPVAMTLAAKHPSRVSALVLINTFARFLRADDYPIGMPEKLLKRQEEFGLERWGTPEYFEMLAPETCSDEELMGWLTRYQKLSTSSRRAAMTYLNYVREVDVRWILGDIRVPTLVITRRDAAMHRPAYGRYLAEHIPDAKLVELRGADTSPPFANDFESVIDEIEEFLTGTKPGPRAKRRVAAVMFTDIVDSTRMAGDLGDEQWLALLKRHDDLKRRYLDHYGGREVKSIGDGFLAVFDAPTYALECARALRPAYSSLGLEVRFGIHGGEIEETDGDISGMAVNIAARICDFRQEGGITVSRTVKEMIVGSGLEMEPLGTYNLKGVPEEWDLYSVVESAL